MNAVHRVGSIARAPRRAARRLNWRIIACAFCEQVGEQLCRIVRWTAHGISFVSTGAAASMARAEIRINAA